MAHLKKMTYDMTETTKPGDIEILVERAGTDAEAFGKLYDLYYERMLHFCFCRVFDQTEAEDLVSCIFLEVARRIRSFCGRTEQDFRNWLFRIAVNQVNYHIRKKRRREELFKEALRRGEIYRANQHNPSKEIDQYALYSALIKLKPKYQTVIVLRFFENLQYEDIAEIFKSKPSTIRATVHRALNKLKVNLQSLSDSEVRNV